MDSVYGTEQLLTVREERQLHIFNENIHTIRYGKSIKYTTYIFTLRVVLLRQRKFSAWNKFAFMLFGPKFGGMYKNISSVSKLCKMYEFCKLKIKIIKNV